KESLCGVSCLGALVAKFFSNTLLTHYPKFLRVNGFANDAGAFALVVETIDGCHSIKVGLVNGYMLISESDWRYRLLVKLYPRTLGGVGRTGAVDVVPDHVAFSAAGPEQTDCSIGRRN